MTVTPLVNAVEHPVATVEGMLAGHQQAIQAERDRKLEAARQQRKNRRQRAA